MKSILDPGFEYTPGAEMSGAFDERLQQIEGARAQ